jgi:hypothetical protein
MCRLHIVQWKMFFRPPSLLPSFFCFYFVSKSAMTPAYKKHKIRTFKVDRIKWEKGPRQAEIVTRPWQRALHSLKKGIKKNTLSPRFLY